MLYRLSISLAQLKTEKNSEKLKNETTAIFFDILFNYYILYPSK